MFNSKVLKIYAIIAVCFLGTGAPYAFAATQEHSHKNEATQKYYCPMHPQIVSDKPGVCPICHMKLVLQDEPSEKVSTIAVHGRVPVKLSDSQRQLLSMATAVVEERSLQQTLKTWGVLAHDPELYEFQVEFLRIERTHYEWDRTRNPLSYKRELTPWEKLDIEIRHRGLSEDWMKDVIAVGKPDRRLIFHHEGEGTWFYIYVHESLASNVKKGDKVELVPQSGSLGAFEGEVQYVDQVIDASTRMIKIRVLSKNTPKEMMPNAPVDAIVHVDWGVKLSVPEEAIIFTGMNQLVFVANENEFSPRDVKLGVKTDHFYEVKEGLMAGEKVASSGNFLIDSESRLKAAVSGMAHQGHEGHAQ